MKEDDEEDMDNNGTKMEKGPTKITFVWGSPLHRMKVPVENGPYEIVELSPLEDDNSWMSENVTTGETKQHTHQYGLEDGQDLRNDKFNIFAKFGYDDLPDIDTSDDDQIEPVDFSNTFQQIDIPSSPHGNAWPFANLKGEQKNTTFKGLENKVICDDVDNSDQTGVEKTSDSDKQARMYNNYGVMKDSRESIDMQEDDTTGKSKIRYAKGGNETFSEETTNFRSGGNIIVEHGDQTAKDVTSEDLKDMRGAETGKREEDFTDFKDNERVQIAKDSELIGNSTKFKIVKPEDEKAGEDVNVGDEFAKPLQENDKENSNDGPVMIRVNNVERIIESAAASGKNEDIIAGDKTVLENKFIKMNEQPSDVTTTESILTKQDEDMIEEANAKEEEVYDAEQILRTTEIEEMEHLQDSEQNDYIKGHNESKDLEFRNEATDNNKQRNDDMKRKEAIEENYTTSNYHNDYTVHQEASLGNYEADISLWQNEVETQPRNATKEITGKNSNKLRNVEEDKSSLLRTNASEYNERDSVLTMSISDSERKSDASVKTDNFEKSPEQKASVTTGIPAKGHQPQASIATRNSENQREQKAFVTTHVPGNQSIKIKSRFYSNIKTPTRSEQISQKNHYGGAKPKIPVVRKEYDNSFQFFKDLRSLGSPGSNNNKYENGDTNYHANDTDAEHRNNIPLSFKEPDTSINAANTAPTNHISEFTTSPIIVDKGSGHSTEQNVGEPSVINQDVDDFMIRHFEHKDKYSLENAYCTEVRKDKRDRKPRRDGRINSNELDSSRRKQVDDSMQTSSFRLGGKSTDDDSWNNQVDNANYQNWYSMETSFEEQANQPWRIGENQSFSNEYDSPVDNDVWRPELSKGDRQSATLGANHEKNIPLSSHQQPYSWSLQKSYGSVLSHRGQSSPEHKLPFRMTSRRRDRKSWYDSTYSTEGQSPIQEYLDILTEYMDHIGFDVKNVSGDGNCLFAAVVDQLRINGDFMYSTDSLRTKSVQYLRAKPHVDDETHLEEFLTNETWSEYLERMDLDGEWGDDIILRGISELTGRKIVIYSSYMSRTEVTPTHVFQKEVVYIGHIKQLMHFVSLRPKMWEVLWPMRALIRRSDKIKENLQLAITMKLSFADELIRNNRAKCEEALKAGAVNDCRKILDETEDVLKDVKSEGNDFLAEFDTTGSMEALLHEKFSFDQISGIPMAHLSFLIKTLIKPKLFRSEDQELKSVFDYAKDKLVRIGVEALEIMADLIDYSSLWRGMSLTDREPEKKPKILQLNLVSKFTNKTYGIKDSIQENSPHHYVKDVLVIDDSETLPGYTRLRPTNTTYWSGCVEWVSCQDAFLRDLHVKKLDDQLIKNFPNLSVKNFKGLECKMWPRQAFEWTKKRSVSGWPSEVNVKEASEKGCLLIQRASAFSENPDIEWRFVFNEAEEVLVKSFSDPMVYCFRVFHALVSRHSEHLKVELKPYWILTAMFYCSEIIPMDCWSLNPGGCILYLVSWLLRQVREKYVPNYFIPDNNMIEELEDDEIRTLEYNLQALRYFPIACIYFLIESRGFLRLHIIDNIESSIEDYRKLKEKHKVVERTFVPLCFSLAKQQMRGKLIPFYYDALEYIEQAYEETVSVEEGGNIVTFVDFMLNFLSSVRDGDVKLSFVQLVDKVKKTHLSQLMLKHTESQTISDILGCQYTGPWANAYIDVSEDKWNSIYTLTGSLFIGREFEDCAEILRCSLNVLQTELKEDRGDCSEISDDRMRKRKQSSNHKHVFTTLRYLVTFYKHLATCYEHMNQTELFQEHIHDYEEIVGRIDSSGHYQYLAQIYRQLGNREKAEELEKKTKSTGEKRSSLLVLINR